MLLVTKRSDFKVSVSPWSELDISYLMNNGVNSNDRLMGLSRAYQGGVL